MTRHARLMAALLATAVSTAASATIIFTPGNHPQPDEENIFFEDPGTVDGPATTITGHVDHTTPGQFVSFSSSENLQPTASGQADVEAVDGAFRDLTISLIGGTFGDFIFNPAIGGRGNSVNGTMVVTVNPLTGPAESFNFNVGSAGNNFLTITTSGGSRISSISLSTTASALDITRLAQPRISGACALDDPTCAPVVPVPEPGGLALVAAGLLAWAGLRRGKA